LPENRKSKQALKEILLSEFSLPKRIQIKAIRNWVNINSTHKIDDEHDQYAFQIHKVLKKLMQYHITKKNPPHLSCGPRSYAMKALLELVGIRSRIIDIFQITVKQINSHTLIEVYCSDTKSWVLQDPDFNVEYALATAKALYHLVKCRQWTKPKSSSSVTGLKFKVENEVNGNSTIARRYDQCTLYRYSYDSKRSKLLLTDKALLKMDLTLQNETITVEQYMNQRGHSPGINLLSDNQTALI
jgi:hypothetical protein